MSIDQTSSRNECLSDSDSCDDPKGCDITIKREGSGFHIEYTVMANPHTPLDAAATDAFAARRVNLDAERDVVVS